MARNFMTNPTFTALAELGLLCLGAPLPEAGGEALSGPHAYRGHIQFCQYENSAYRHPFPDSSAPLYDIYGPDLTIAQALKLTNLIIMLGAEHDDALQRCLDDPETMVLIFEPDAAAMAKFVAATKPSKLAQQRTFLFLGDPYSFNPPLQDMLPRKVFIQGTPAVFQTPRIAEHYGDWAEKTAEYMEILHYRHSIYPLTGQAMKHSRPLRVIKRERTYVQQLHAYENIGDFLVSPDIRQLRNRLKGQTAILVAAGPALPEKFDYIRKNRDRTVVICVNNALKPLSEAGIKPHFAVINDTSFASAEVFEHIPKQSGTILVAHCMAGLGGDRFRQKYLFGTYKEDVFQARPDLDLHGSVITTAFSLARHMGCARCVIAGAQLASHDPTKLAYAKGTTNHSPDMIMNRQRNGGGSLYPVHTPFGETLYTTVNFRDAALWLTEEIRLSGIECVNTTKDSILYGQGIRYESEPELPEASTARIMADLFKPEPPLINRRIVQQYLVQEKGKWVALRKAATDVLGGRPAQLIANGEVVLKQLDELGVTFMVEGFPGFDTSHFHALAFSGDAGKKADGFRYFYENLQRMSSALLDALDAAAQAYGNRG